MHWLVPGQVALLRSAGSEHTSREWPGRRAAHRTAADLLQPPRQHLVVLGAVVELCGQPQDPLRRGGPGGDRYLDLVLVPELCAERVDVQG
ncbi:MAG: hypothetical protein D8M61_20915, partial [Ignavibacteriae bacterium]|nr:hypothetical protein [Ignavibacteriota bacterium]